MGTDDQSPRPTHNGKIRPRPSKDYALGEKFDKKIIYPLAER